MKLVIKHNDKTYKLDSKYSSDISIPYNFNGPQPNFYNVEPGTLKPLKIKNKLFSVKHGMSCNVFEAKFNIHCTGTHTECVGHLTEHNISVSKCINNIFFPTLLLTIAPINFSDCSDKYHIKINNNELVIDKKSLQSSFEHLKIFKPEALVIRTTPNPKNKQFYSYSKNTPPFFTNDAIQFLIKQNIKHLIVDLPSIDRMDDDGILGNHRIFWGQNNITNGKINLKSKKTITELAYIDNFFKDGFYFLNISIPNFQCDAAPSRPILFSPIY